MKKVRSGFNIILCQKGGKYATFAKELFPRNILFAQKFEAKNVFISKEINPCVGIFIEEHVLTNEEKNEYLPYAVWESKENKDFPFTSWEDVNLFINK